ncbi:ER membrane protein complex subunit 1 [Pleurostoma richardsiae]|uniref:ER membrane protein complex subunit 1 n=1 Tax=Pleurostoma richardsiae TaxID=41990 RepID=A0AA38SBD8_9PEZI|nr:ER membrane protein complex subunit 1 [Pleurostoma richardsiae]
MLPLSISALLLAALPSTVRAVFQDEVGHIDYHYELLGVPQSETTFFHKPRREDKASLLYTLSDVGVLGAVNPSSGAVIWRQPVAGNITNGGGFLRAGEGESWLAGAYGSSVHAWDAVGGRNLWWVDFAGEVKDLEIMELTEGNRKDILVLFEEAGSTILRRLHGTDGSVVWEFKETTKDLPLQVSTNVEKVFVVSLHGTLTSYTLRVSVIDTLTGKRLDELPIGTKHEVTSEKDVMFVGANMAAPIVAWTDASLTRLKINVLGTKGKQEFPLPPDTVSVEIHSPHLVQSQPHFLVHSRTISGHRGEVYHVNLKTHAITKAYDLPLLPGPGAFATTSEGANVYFTRVTANELILTSSTSHGILGRWPLKTGKYDAHAVHGVSEVVKKSEDSFAVRSAVVTDADDWVIVRNGELAWSRPEGLTGAVAAAFAEVPEAAEFAKTLEAEAHSNPWSAYVHRVQRHIDDLQGLPDYLASIPQRLLGSILGTDVTSKKEGLAKDSFGFNKLVIVATRRGRLYGLDAGNHGKMLWNKKAFSLESGETWDVKGIYADDAQSLVDVRGAKGDYIVVKPDTGVTVDSTPPGSSPVVQGSAIVEGSEGKWLLPIGLGGDVEDVPAARAPKQIVVVRRTDTELAGLKFVPKETYAAEEITWIFSLPASQRIANVATRSPHDPVASIGRVLGDRSVKYKYLNPNTVVVAAADDAASTLTVYLLDTVSGQILASATHEGVDTQKPVECALSENWYVCSFFGEYNLKSNPTQFLKGYHISVTDLYESDLANDRGPLGDAANFSSIEPVDRPTGPALPSVVSQSFILAAPVSALTVTQTRQGITSRQLLAYLPDTHSIIGIPRSVLEPRRPVGRDPTPAEMEEGLMKYLPSIEMDPKLILTHERDVLGVQKIITAPAIVESTSLVFAYGIDVFGTRVAPSFTFDILGKGFNKLSLVSTVLALMAGVFALAPIVRKKQINTRWNAPL